MKPRLITQPTPWFHPEATRDKGVANPSPFEGDLFRWRLASFSCFCFCFLATHATYWLSKRHFDPRAMAWVCV